MSIYYAPCFSESITVFHPRILLDSSYSPAGGRGELRDDFTGQLERQFHKPN
jgi:hypothetical protein